MQALKMPRFMRGRPLLGAAVVVGASRSVAKHEVAKQNQMSSDAQRQADAAYQQQVQEEAARDQKTHLAIEAALADERSRNKSPMMHSNQEIIYSGQRREGVTGYCAACGTQRAATDRFCGGCGMKHAEAVMVERSPPEYLETGVSVDDSKDLLA
jgi:L-fucose isomerase-like protein